MFKYAYKQLLFLCYDLPSLATKNVQWFFLLFRFSITGPLLLDYRKLPYLTKVVIIIVNLGLIAQKGGDSIQRP